MVQPIGGLLQHFEQVVLDVLEDEINEAPLAKCFPELHNVGVIKHFEDLNLSHGGPFYYLVLV